MTLSVFSKHNFPFLTNCDKQSRSLNEMSQFLVTSVYGSFDIPVKKIVLFYCLQSSHLTHTRCNKVLGIFIE